MIPTNIVQVFKTIESSISSNSHGQSLMGFVIQLGNIIESNRQSFDDKTDMLASRTVKLKLVVPLSR
jgi:hypothetical protein